MKKIITSKGPIDLDIPDNPVLTSDGEHYIICPICSPFRKPQHQNEKKLAINLKKHPIPWRCNHCGEGGYVMDKEYLESLKIKPITTSLKWNDLDEKIIDYFAGRKISRETLAYFKIVQSYEPIYQRNNPDPKKKDKVLNTLAINFPYFKDGFLINVKYRDSRKNFKMITGASKVFYNIDAIKGSKKAVIVEGELDVLSYHEVGIEYVVSVPNGSAISDKEKEEYEKTKDPAIFREVDYEYLDNCIEDFDHCETIYIATDDDPAGIKLREQLSRRLGKKRCSYILFSKYAKQDNTPCKDANDVLIHCGGMALRNSLATAIAYPLDNVFRAGMFMDDMKRDFIEGSSRGLSTGFLSLDPHFLWMRGWTYLVNGYPSQGKSTMLFNLILASTLIYKWHWGVYLPENYPIKNVVVAMAEILAGNSAERTHQGRMEYDKFEAIILKHIDKYIHFVDNDKGLSPEQLRVIKEDLVKRHGLVGFFADPWLALNHEMRPKFGSVDEYINYELNYEIRLAQSLNIINIFAHHPSTPFKTKDKEYEAPSPFEPVGGQIWYNKVFSMICIHRDNQNELGNTLTQFHVQKQKVEKLAGIRTNRYEPLLLKYDRRSNRFYERNDNSDDSSQYDTTPFDKYKLEFDENINFEF